MRTRVPLAAGTVLGRYRILRLAGEGGMGDVYEAFDDSLERIVALKRVRGGPAEDNRLERFRREALALAQLNHPGLCQVFELAQTDRGAFIAMEWVEGRTLSDRLLDGPLPWREAAGLLGQIAGALAAAHAKGIIHRDLKPGNVMLTPGGQAKVLDFGLARFADSPEEPPPTTGETPRLEASAGRDPSADPGDAETLAASPGASGPRAPRSGSGRSLTLVGSFMGTLGYASPEQALARSVGPPTDVFNLGILAQELVTAQRPFPGQGKDALDAVVDGRRLPLPRSLAPKAYRALVDRLLAPKPQDRPAAEEAAAAFAALLAPKGALWWTGVGAVSVAVLAFSGYWLSGRGVLAGLVKGRPARVAVMGFRNDTGQPMLKASTELGLADLVASGLLQAPKLQIIRPDDLAQAARALKIDPASATPADQLRLARALGADLLLSGAVDRREGQDHLAYALIDRQERIRAQGDAQAPRLAESMLNGTPLARALARDLRKAVDPLGKDARPEPYDIPPQALSDYAQGLEAYRHGRYKDAELLLKRAAYAVPEWTDAVAVYAYDLTQLARESSGDALRWALVAARKARNSQDEASVIQTLGSLAVFQRDFTAGRSYFSQALKAAEIRGDQSSRSFCLNGLGLVAQSEGHQAEAAACFEQALQAAETTGDQIAQGKILTNLGNLALAQGDLRGAEARYRAVVDAAVQAGSESNEALGLNNLGIVLLSEFKSAEAKAALERSLAIREKNGDAYGVVSSLRNLGINALAEGQGSEARARFRASLQKADASAFGYGQGQALFYLAECDRMAGDLNAALRGYEEALVRSEAAHDRDKQGPELAGKAECLIRMHRVQEGAGALAKAISLAPRNPCILRAQAWQAFAQGRRTDALDLVRQAILDPTHDAPEARLELQGLRTRFQSPSAVP